MYTFGLIGYPIKHSLSPWIHTTFLEQKNLKGTYELFEVSPQESIEQKLQTLKDKGVQGCNVTVPYKETVLPYLDVVDESAVEIGAINTIVFKNGKTYGYNTDGKGYVRSLETSFPGVFTPSLRILLIGAGGAARGIYRALLDKGCKEVSIANRTLSTAESIREINQTETKSMIMSLEEAEEQLASYDVVIQTTSVGMKPHEEQSILSLNNIRQGTIVSDIVYQPIETSFLREAAARQCQVHYGHTMLLYQAQYAFELWTGTKPEIGTMDGQLQHTLEGK